MRFRNSSIVIRLLSIHPNDTNIIELRRNGNHQVSITMPKCINGRLPARIGTGGKPFRYSLLVYTAFMKKSLIQRHCERHSRTSKTRVSYYIMYTLDTMTILRCFGVVLIMRCLQIVESGRKICLFLKEAYKPDIKLSNIYKSFLNIKKNRNCRTLWHPGNCVTLF